MTNGSRGQRGFRPHGPTIGNFQPIAARSFCLVGGPRGRGGWRLLSGSSGKGPGRNICVGRENEFSSEVGTEEAVPALRGGPRGVEGRPGRAASTPRTPPPGRRRPARVALYAAAPGAKSREVSVLREQSRAWPPPPWGSRGPARFLGVRALRAGPLGWVWCARSLRSPPIPIGSSPCPSTLAGWALRRRATLVTPAWVWRVPRAATFIPAGP